MGASRARSGCSVSRSARDRPVSGPAPRVSPADHAADPSPPSPASPVVSHPDPERPVSCPGRRSQGCGHRRDRSWPAVQSPGTVGSKVTRLSLVRRGLRTTPVKPRSRTDRAPADRSHAMPPPGRLKHHRRDTFLCQTCVRCRASARMRGRVLPNSRSGPCTCPFRLGLLTTMPATRFVLSSASDRTDTSGVFRASIPAPEASMRRPGRRVRFA